MNVIPFTTECRHDLFESIVCKFCAVSASAYPIFFTGSVKAKLAPPCAEFVIETAPP